MMKDIKTPFKTINCPQCGYALPLYFAHAKLAQCESCNSSIFLDDEAARLTGYSSVLAPEPSLIQLNKTFRYKKQTFLPVGVIRYSYGRGFWEEWWLKDNSDDEWWLSVDEGDMVLEKLVPNEDKAEIFVTIKVGQTLGDWIVTEIDRGECVGFGGSLPYEVIEGQKHNYIQFDGYDASIKTLEVDPSGLRTYIGRWIDPFDIKVL